ncbi:hypothetical protein [Pantoea sp. CTOTU46764]|uniref:hypothetical protein n=1 Tax=Pantoea sp. CTOTU46764 TaxID=2953854 RepID=UPI0028A24E08|nr:hypothetical protein [Pantoea sp. CTOTU46764]
MQRRTHVYTSGRRIMKMKTLEDIRAEILQSMQKAHSNDSSTGNASKISASSTPEELQKASTVAQDALTAAVADYLAQSTATKNAAAAAALTAANASALKAPRGKRIKDKGIALCHESQGYSANLRPDSLLMKAGKPGISLQVNKAALIDAPPELLATLKRLGFETSI